MSLPNPSMSFTPFDILTASEMNDLVDNIESLSLGTGLEDGAVTPEKRSGGFHIQIIPGSLFGSTGTINVTGVPFKASLIEFDVIFPFSTTTGTTATGKCTDTDQFFAYSALSSANQRRGSASSSCIGWDNASGSQIMRASRTSINNDGVTLEVQSANNSFDVAATFHR